MHLLLPAGRRVLCELVEVTCRFIVCVQNELIERVIREWNHLSEIKKRRFGGFQRTDLIAVFLELTDEEVDQVTLNFRGRV